MSRNQNDLTAQYPELQSVPTFIKAENAVLDGEVVALDDQGRASFSLMQQRTGIRRADAASRLAAIFQCCITFSICFISMATTCAGWRWKERKDLLAKITTLDDPVRYSDHFPQGKALFEVAKKKG